MDYAFLQQYWWFLVSLLGALLVFLLFVQGGQTFIFAARRDEPLQRMIVNSTGRKWEFTLTTLVTFGGAFFASSAPRRCGFDALYRWQLHRGQERYLRPRSLDADHLRLAA